jgi:hypothetical protein
LVFPFLRWLRPLTVRLGDAANFVLYAENNFMVESGEISFLAGRYIAGGMPKVVACKGSFMTVLQQSKGDELAVERRLAALDWASAEESLSERGYAVTAALLTAEECAELVALYADEKRFRSHIIMERYRFGVGDYKYFDNPLPRAVASLRTSAYPHLATVANRWAEALGEGRVHARYPSEHAAFLKICHQAGQKKPTPLMLHYEAGGYNCLHQDLYGHVSFPLQMVLLLGQAGRDWEGGEFILVEQQPRAQSKAEVVRGNQGQAIIFTTRHRPVKGTRGYYRVNLRHGVSRVHRGTRYTLGIVFHDAK